MRRIERQAGGAKRRLQILTMITHSMFLFRFAPPFACRSLADVTGGFSLGFDMASQKPWNVSAYDANYGVGWSGEISVAELIALPGGGTDYMALKLKEVGDGDLDLNIDVSTLEWFLESASANEIIFRVRFYQVEGDEWLKLADGGGDLPLMVIEQEDLVGGVVVVNGMVDGSVPVGAVPVNEMVLANQRAGEQQAEQEERAVGRRSEVTTANSNDDCSLYVIFLLLSSLLSSLRSYPCSRSCGCRPSCCHCGCGRSCSCYQGCSNCHQTGGIRMWRCS